MTTLTGNVSNIIGQDMEGTLSLAAAYHRGVDDTLVLADWADIPIIDSAITAEDITPGPARMRVAAGGVYAEWDVVIPDEGEVIITELVSDNVDYPEPVILAAQAAALRATKEANRAEEAAAIVGSAERVLEAEVNSAASAASAATAADEAITQAQTSTTQADRATDEATRASNEADRAAGQATAATNSASASDRSAIDAEASATAASGARAGAEQARTDAVSARDDAREARTGAETAQTAAETASAGAETARTGAEQAVVAAVADVTTEVETMKSAAETAATTAGTHATAAKQSAVAAAASAASAAEVVSSGVADATAEVKGKLRLTGDLAGTADTPTVPALAITAPGANLSVSPVKAGWSYATGPEAQNAGWVFDGTWLVPPAHVMSGVARVDWCGSTAVEIRGRRRADGTMVTIGTVPAGTAETHRSVTVDIDLMVYGAVAVASTWAAGDLEAGCLISVIVLPDVRTETEISDVTGLQDALDTKASSSALSSGLAGKAATVHSHSISQVGGLEAALDGKADGGDLVALQGVVAARPAMWIWDGVGEWSAPEGASAIDTVLNLDSGEVHAITEVE